jgi:Arc/MetJ-type ribon-helix-helix transcriptional regulator
MKSLTIRLPDELVARLEAEAIERKLSKSEVIRERLEHARSRNPRRALFDAIIDLVFSGDRLHDDPSTQQKKHRKPSGGNGVL